MKLQYLAILLLAPALYAQANIAGTWKIAVDRGDGTFENRYMELSQSGDTVSGTVVRNYGKQNIQNGTFDGKKLEFKVNPWRDVIDDYQGVLDGDKLHMTITTQASANSHHGAVHGDAVRDSGAGMQPPAYIAPPALHDVADNGLARTPPMGWNSWNHFASRVDDAVVRAAADAIVSSGMKDAGYIYVNIDDTWEAGRDAQGNIQTNKKFPDMKALADYVHSKGLKLGIYSSPGPTTCAGYEGSYGHEAQDAKTYAGWGIDYLKYDWCSAGHIYKNSDLQPIYQKMGDALLQSGRPIVFSLCEYGNGDVWTWGAKVGGNLWRTTGDIGNRWSSMEEIGFKQIDIAQYEQPGHFNDPDMLEIGNGGLSGDEERTHMTLWSLLSAPLLAGNDLATMSKETLAILTNRDVVAIDQDPAVKHPKRTVLEGKTEAWTRELQDGFTVIALFNREDDARPVTVSWSKVGLTAGGTARDLWNQKDITLSGDSYTATVPRHGVVLLRVSSH